jgi:hypothetical protein
MDQKIRLKAPPVRPKPRDTKPQKMFQHFDSEEERQRYLKEVEELQRSGQVPF